MRAASKRPETGSPADRETKVAPPSVEKRTAPWALPAQQAPEPSPGAQAISVAKAPSSAWDYVQSLGQGAVDDIRACWDTFERLGRIRREDVLEPGRCSAFMVELFAHVPGVVDQDGAERWLALPA
jgi:hypothetical protein